MVMYCPRCGQQQLSDQTKFCSRCGFQMGLVFELLTHGGFLPQLAELYQGKKSLFTRKNGVIFGILWFIFFVMMVPAFFAIANADDAAGASAVFGIFSTLMILIVSLAFLKKSSKTMALPAAEMHTQPAGLYGTTPHAAALPPPQSQPASSYVPPAGGWKADTSDLGVPNSVTESTTRLLHKEEDQ